MKFLLDNTGYHAIGRCLEGRATGEADLSNFLQFATQLVFSETVGISGSQPKGVAERSASVTQSLLACDVSKNVIPQLTLPKEGYLAAMSCAAQRFNDGLQYCNYLSKLIANDTLVGHFPERNSHEARFDYALHRMITMTMSSAERDALLVEATATGASGWPFYMYGTSKALQDSLAQIRRDIAWTEAHTANLTVYLRYFMNEEIAYQLSGPTSVLPTWYSPSVTRARVVSNTSKMIFNSLDASLSEAIAELKPVSLQAPPIATALVMLGKSEPRNILREAMIAREAARPLREHFASIMKNSTKSSESGRNARHEIQLALKDVGAPLKKAFYRSDLHQFTDVLEFNFLGISGCPNPFKFFEWRKLCKQRTRITVLTEFAKTITDYEADPNHYDRFKHNAMRET